MVSIASLVAEIISEKPFLEIALGRGIINYAKLADEIKDELLARTSLDPNEVKSSAIMMALRRLSKNFPRTLSDLKGLDEYLSDVVLDHSKFTLSALTLKTGSFTKEILERLQVTVDPQIDYLSITQGRVETTIIIDQRHFEYLTKLFPQDSIIQSTTDLASLTLKIPESASDVPGVFYLVTKEFFWDNVNIFEVVSTFTEMTYILKENDIPAALHTLKRLLGNNSH